MGTVNFIFGIHNHQPVGNFHSVFELAYEKSYRPLMETLRAHPGITWNLHVSGCLWDWLKVHRPEYLQQVKEMVDQGRLELLAGGYYEPILSCLTDTDKHGQIKMLKEFLESTFQVAPTGAWLTERIWEPQLPKVFCHAGIDYTIVDDAHFLSSGISADQLTGYYTTEDQGYAMNIFPIHKILRYMIPFAPPEDVINYLRAFADTHNEGLLCMADDGEKFGLWPGTYAHVYEKRWLDRFFGLLESQKDWIKTWKFSDFQKAYPSRGIVYMPTSSYFEMAEWTLPPAMAAEYEKLVKNAAAVKAEDRILPLLRGANWRNFFQKYSESNALHKKMLLVSRKVHQMRVEEKERDLKQDAMKHLWAGQCNCAYWHGVFGGLYLPHLRNAVYENLLKAESIADYTDYSFGKRYCKHEVLDYNADGMDELLIEGRTQNCYFAPHKGGALVEWDHKGAGVNLTNVMTRRKELYHDRIASVSPAPAAVGAAEPKTIHDLIKSKEAGLENYLFYDWHERLSFLDHFLHPNVTLEAFRQSKYGEQGNFTLAHYKWLIHEEKNKNLTVSMHTQGQVWVNDKHSPLMLKKEFEFLPDGRINVTYQITNLSLERIDLWFAVELNALLAHAFDAPLEQTTPAFALRDISERVTLQIDFHVPTVLWLFPLETISQSEDGFERTYQGLTLAPHVKFTLDVAATFTWQWSVIVSPVS